MIALDTTLLVHAHRWEASLHPQAFQVILRLARSDSPWGACLHTLVEFYGLAPHPRLRRQPSTPEQTVDQIAVWRECPTMRVLMNNPQTLALWSHLVLQARIQGALVLDAHIAASCHEQGVREIWTGDRDFSRFPALKARNPLL